MKKSLYAALGVVLVAAIALYIYRQTVQSDLRRKDGMCVDAVRKDVPSGYDLLTRSFGTIAGPDGPSEAETRVIDVYVGPSVANPPLDRYEFYTHTLICRVDKYGVVGIRMERGPHTQNGIRNIGD